MVHERPAAYEGHYTSVIHSCFVMQDFEPVGEDGGSRRHADMALQFNGWVYLLEFKVVERGPEGTALGQPRRKGYADKYRDPGLPVHLIGAEFSREERNIVAFSVEATGGISGPTVLRNHATFVRGPHHPPG